jgi:hypothetical protein
MPKYLIGSGLPDLPSGLSDKDASMVTPLYMASSALAAQLSLLTGNIQYSQDELAVIDPLSGLPDRQSDKIYFKALVDSPYGCMLNLAVVDGKITAQKADATTTAKPAHAICDTVGGVLANQFGVAIFLRGRSKGIAGTTFGQVYYLSTNGNVQAVPPGASGSRVQVIGMGLGSGGIYVDIEIPR